MEIAVRCNTVHCSAADLQTLGSMGYAEYNFFLIFDRGVIFSAMFLLGSGLI